MSHDPSAMSHCYSGKNVLSPCPSITLVFLINVQHVYQFKGIFASNKPLLGVTCLLNLGEIACKCVYLDQYIQKFVRSALNYIVFEHF